MKTAMYKCETPKCKATHTMNIGGKRQVAFCYEEAKISSFKLVRGTTVDSVHKVFMPLHNSDFIVDTDFSEAQIRSNARHFFTNSRRGERETYTFHRGCVISRRTVTFTGCKPERLTTAFLFGKFTGGDGSLTFCVVPPVNGEIKSVDQAKRHLDRILAANHYERP